MARRAFLASLALASLIATAAEAGPPTSTLQATFAQANRIIADPAMEDRPLDRIVEIRALFAKVFDFRGAAARPRVEGAHRGRAAGVHLHLLRIRPARLRLLARGGGRD